MRYLFNFINLFRSSESGERAEEILAVLGGIILLTTLSICAFWVAVLIQSKIPLAYLIDLVFLFLLIVLFPAYKYFLIKKLASKQLSVLQIVGISILSIFVWVLLFCVPYGIFGFFIKQSTYDKKDIFAAAFSENIMFVICVFLWLNLITGLEMMLLASSNKKIFISGIFFSLAAAIIYYINGFNLLPF